ncbi:plastocyanin/azurin family copper-binding protein [Halopiger xanaduensis]|uniref:plastocyanin/azurin family copper-binding protein n=1 Tax=Halopiger xanaduensis TaxID=387343 RepID=UPI001FE1481F|nr:plastocyanin/azurin family copper-binding protein [Halopiger xanaduensis]
MKDADPITRRTVLKITGVAGVTTALAGCGGPGGGGNESEDNETETDTTTDETETGDNETETEPGDEAENETEDNETDNESAEDGGTGEAIEPGTEIMLEGSTQAWTATEPESIADEENPTLTLVEGESYDITWENADGAQHNLVIWDDSDEIVDDYETDMVSEEGETATLEIDEVTSEMAQYVCEPHSSTMVGDIELESGDGGGMGDNETDGNESAGNESDELGGNESDNESAGNESEDNESDENESDDNESDL